MTEKTVMAILVCPECGRDLFQVDKIAHALSHWPEYLDPAKSSKEARKRQAQLLAGGITQITFVKLHEEE